MQGLIQHLPIGEHTKHWLYSFYKNLLSVTKNLLFVQGLFLL